MAISDVQGRPWIDTTEFTRTGQRLSGRCALARLVRLSGMLTDDQGELEWSLEGERSRRSDGGFDGHLALFLRGAVRMRCVRCLEPVQVEIEDRRHFKLVVTESVAEREDPQNDEFDLLVTSAHFEVLDLLEDEAIMALPLAPGHDACERPDQADGATGRTGALAAPVEEPERPNPFAVLAGLRKTLPSGDGEN